MSHLLRVLEAFGALDSESIDTATPAGKMVFTVLGAVAELERSLIVERVKAGLRNARAKRKEAGTPTQIPGRCQDSQAAQRWPLVAQDRASDGVFVSDSAKGVAEVTSGGFRHK